MPFLVQSSRCLSEFLDIWRIIILTSAISRTVNIAAKSQKVVITAEVETADMAALVGRRSCTVQG